jgi:hypothetical protein
MTEEERLSPSKPDFISLCMQPPRGCQGELADESERSLVLQTPKKPASATSPATDGAKSTFVTQGCDECGGTGRDPGALNPWDPEPCPTCLGTKLQSVERNYLVEAFRIVAGLSHLAPEKEHLKAVIKYCREMTSAALSLPEVV